MRILLVLVALILPVNALAGMVVIGAGAGGAESGTWESVWNPADPDEHYDWGTDLNMRIIVDSGQTASAGPWTKIRVQYGSCQALTLTASVCIKAAANGNCTAVPTQVTWNTGSTTWSASANDTITSDDIDFSFDTDDDLVFIQFEPVGKDCYNNASGVTSYEDSTGNGDETLTQSPNYTSNESGYNSYVDAVWGWNPD